MKKHCCLRLLVAITPILVGSHFSDTVNAATFFVATDGDNSDGLTWETAFVSIDAAMVASSTGDSFWLKAGKYTSRRQTVVESRHLFGGFEGTESLTECHLRNWEENQTFISGEEMSFVEPILILGGHSTLNGIDIGHHASALLN